MKRKDLLGLKELSGDEILEILRQAAEMKKQFSKEDKRTDLLKGKTVVTLFYENSTRTRVSFETAAKLLGASTCNISASASSVQKGESLIDTGKTLKALLADAIVIRHPCAGAPHLLAANVPIPVLNGGDGANEHPTQALLDMLTIQERFKTFKGLKVAIIGDIKHSRVARSNLWGLNKLGASVTLAAPYTLLPDSLDKMNCTVTTDIDKALSGADVVMGLRLQLERQGAGLFPSGGEYHDYYGITPQRMLKANYGAILLHPGPINRGLELSGEAADDDNSLILEQVTNGIAVRMAVLKMLMLGR